MKMIRMQIKYIILKRIEYKNKHKIYDVVLTLSSTLIFIFITFMQLCYSRNLF